MLKVIYRSILLTLLMAILLCGVYPASIWLIAKVAFPSSAAGGIVFDAAQKPVGAKLIGQNFAQPQYFHGRPSAAGANGYDPTASGGSNLGPTSQKLLKNVEGNVAKVLQENPTLKPGQVPVLLVTTSASGLDPHISPEAALIQVERVAKARSLSTDVVRQLVSTHTEGRQLGFLGEPVVNVLAINLALDQMAATR